MTITIESGQAASDSVAYCSVAQADAYHASRGVAAWAALTTEQKETALVRGCDFIGQQYRGRWAGQRASSTQALDFPRYNVPMIESFSGSIAAYYPSDAIPRDVIYANAEAALRAAAGEMIEDLEPQVVSEEVGPIKTVFAQHTSRGKKFPVIDKMLQPLLSGQGGLKLVRC
jgi:hypothetical protein